MPEKWKPKILPNPQKVYVGRPCPHLHEPLGQRYKIGDACTTCANAGKRTGKYAYPPLLPWVRTAYQLKSRYPGHRTATTEELKALWQRQGGCCAWSGMWLEFNKPSVDHIVPASKGGTHTIENLQWVVGPLNAAKNNTDEDTFQTFMAEFLTESVERLAVIARQHQPQ